MQGRDFAIYQTLPYALLHSIFFFFYNIPGGKHCDSCFIRKEIQVSKFLWLAQGHIKC